MIVKACLAGALALALNPSEQVTSHTFVAHPYIEKITCLRMTEEGIHVVSGTGFKLEDGRWASVNHVTRNIACAIDGKPITVTYAPRKATSRCSQLTIIAGAESRSIARASRTGIGISARATLAAILTPKSSRSCFPGSSIWALSGAGPR